MENYTCIGCGATQQSYQGLCDTCKGKVRCDSCSVLIEQADSIETADDRVLCQACDSKKLANEALKCVHECCNELQTIDGEYCDKHK